MSISSTVGSTTQTEQAVSTGQDIGRCCRCMLVMVYNTEVSDTDSVSDTHLLTAFISDALNIEHLEHLTETVI